MENASKALIMAGGMLIAGLLVALLAYAWTSFSEYQSSRDELKNIEDTAKFNEQFSNYDRDDVMGYEILSLINKVADYNERMTEDTIHDNDDKYKPINLKLILDSKQNDYTNRKKFLYNGDKPILFEESEYEEIEQVKDGRRKSFKKEVEPEIDNAITKLGVDECTLENMARNIGSMFKTSGEIGREATLLKVENETVGKIMVAKFNSYVKNHKLKDDDWSKYLQLNNNYTSRGEIIADGYNLGDVYSMLRQCYEYMQFKRGIFECTNIEYDTGDTGRVTGIEFKFTGIK